MIDIHAHILPGVDDGPRGFNEAASILESAVDSGVRCIVATPHVLERPLEDFWKEVEKSFEALVNDAQKRRIDIEIVLGAEMFISPDIPQMVKENQNLTMNGRNTYLLIELPTWEIPFFTKQIIYELLIQDTRVIIAHPERCMEIQRDANKLFDLITNGALIQINAPSLLGRYGRRVQKSARELLAHNLAHFIGSDVHGVSNDDYCLKAGVDEASKIVGRPDAIEMANSSPEHVLNGRRIQIRKMPKRKRGMFDKMLNRNK